MKFALCHPLRVLLAVIAMLACPTGALAVSHDAAIEFSLSSNPNGLWTYGYSTMLGGAMTTHVDHGVSSGLDYWRTDLGLGVPWVAHNPSASTLGAGFYLVGPGELTVHPGAGGTMQVVRYTVPAAQAARLVGSFFGQDQLGTTTDVHVLRNGVSLFDAFVTGYGPASAVAFDLPAMLAPGDTLDFVVGPNGGFAFDSTGLTALIKDAPVTINASTITNYTGYIIPSDASDGDPSTNRHCIHTEGDVTFSVTGDYRIDWALLDPASVVVATDTETVLGATASQIFQGNLVPSSAAPLVPGKLYRVKMSVVELATGATVGARMEAVGRTYIHFTGTDSASEKLNVVAEVTSVTLAQNWLLETDVTNSKMPVTVNYKLYRFDDWAGASVNKLIIAEVAANVVHDSDGVVQESTATGTGFVSAALASYIAGAPKTPSFITGSATVLVDPSEVVSHGVYRFEATITTNEEPSRLLEMPPVQVTRTGNTGSSTAALLDDYSGKLTFGAIITHFTHLATAPVAYGPPPIVGDPIFRRIAPDANSGTVDGNSLAKYGDGSTLNVILESNGDATFQVSDGVGASSVSLGPVAVPPLIPLAITGSVNGVDFVLGTMILDTTGLHGAVSAALPVGVGWTANYLTGLLDSKVPFTNVTLGQNLAPPGGTAVASFTLGNFYLCEETKPILIETTSLTWDIPTGEFLCGTATARSIRKPLLDILASYSADYSDPSMESKRSNDHLYNFVTTASEISVKTGFSGGGEMTGTIGSDAGEFVTHFPYNSTVKWSAASSIRIADDLIDVAPSSFAGADPVVVKYWQHCQESLESGCGAMKTANITLTPTTGALLFTADGGLQASGTTALPGPLAWGWSSESLQYAHQVSTTFTSGNFLMAGTFLRGDQNTLGDDDGASVLLLSGFTAANLSLPERPLTAGYKLGLGDYAGVNFRCTSGGFSGQSTLQGTAYGAYPLTDRSKYYARRSGVSGIHEATASGFPGTATLAGYLFNFSKYAFTFLSSDLEDSFTAGDIDLTAPVDFTLPFTDLRLTCIGALDTVDVTGAGAMDSKAFAFWNAPFTPYTINFAATDCCNPAEGATLVLGFSAHASHFDAPFAGALGINPTGRFTTEANAMAPVPTRLVLPPLLALTGSTGDQRYTFFPSQGAYLNDATTGVGFWSLFGALDVPFFEDMEVQLHTSAAPFDLLSPLYFMGGWPTQGWVDAASLSPLQIAVFDMDHIGFPTAVASLDAYRKTTDDGTDLYLPRAQKLWLDVIDFDYPLKWSNASANFLSRGPVDGNLLVLETQHELKFLDAKYAEITFGLRYDGLPEISLTNFAFNALDDTTGVASSLVSAAGNEVFSSLESGVGEFGNTLSDEADKLMGRAVDSAISLPVDGLIAAVKNELEDGVWTATDLQDAVTNYNALSSNRIDTALNNLGTNYSNPKSLLADLDKRLAAIETGIDSVINEVTVDPISGVPLGTPANGLLKRIDIGGGDFRRAVFEAAGGALIDTLSTVTSGSIATELNALIAAQEPALASVTSTLTEVRAVISSLRAELQGGFGLGEELRDIIAAANAQIATVAANVDTQSAALFNAVKAEDITAASALDALDVEWHKAIKKIVKDEFYASQVIVDLQTAVKERLYDMQGTFNGAVDSAFAILNQSIRDVLSPVLADLDKTLYGFTGGLNDKIAAGSLTGAAYINGDSLDGLRLDAEIELKVPDSLAVGGFIEIRELHSDGPACCGGGPGDKTVEIEVGARNIGIAWTGLSLATDTRADLSLKANLDFTTGVPLPVGFGGSFEMTQGDIKFETMKVTALAASAMFSIPQGGNAENYFAAQVGLEFGSFGLDGGIFFGRSCDLDPLIMIDPLVAEILPGPTFTGIYAYGAATMPIFGTGTCFFNISAKAGAGVFYGAEGPTYGGRLSLGVFGDALCAVHVEGTIDLVGAKTGSTYSFAGQGRVFGQAGPCPLCVKANLQCDFKYTDASGWDVDF